jgi:hypothetical protein
LGCPVHLEIPFLVNTPLISKPNIMNIVDAPALTLDDDKVKIISMLEMGPEEIVD